MMVRRRSASVANVTVTDLMTMRLRAMSTAKYNFCSADKSVREYTRNSQPPVLYPYDPNKNPGS
jgi:hypothetical protein